MKLFGFEITRAKALPPAMAAPVTGDRGRWWHPIVHEPYTGAWQRNREMVLADTSNFHADFACKTLIARDIAKLRVRLVKLDGGIWVESNNPAYDPVLRRPNRYQTRNQFWESWILSKLSRGNTYVLKVRDGRNVVTGLYVLDPTKVRPLVTPDGDVFYELRKDNLSGLQDETITVPASEIIHDRMSCLFHPLVGLPPVYASALAAMQGLNIQYHSEKFFSRSAAPGGIIMVPGRIEEDDAKRLKEHWNSKYQGPHVGGIAILNEGMTFEKLSMTAVEGQMIEQLKWSAEVVCSVYHVPPYKIGVGALPSYNNVQSLNVEYYSQGLQSLIEEIEECLDHGLGIGWGIGLGTEFDTRNLLRMDSVTQMEVLTKAVQGTIYSPDEARAEVDKPPVTGGSSPMAQHQMYSLEALAKRDAKDDPFATGAAPAPAATASNDNADDDEEETLTDEEIENAKIIACWKLKSLLAA